MPRRKQPTIPDEVLDRRLAGSVHTTNAIEALNAKLRRAVRARGPFPTDDAVLKLLFLVLNLAAEGWRMPARNGPPPRPQFAILFGDRFAVT